MYFYLNLFFIYAIFGYFFETFAMFIQNKNYNSSVLYGPWTIVYGISILIMILVYILLRKKRMNPFKEKIVYFFTITIVLTLLEGLSGYIIEFTQHKIYWNYDDLYFHIGHYMALEISLIWGIMSLISIYIILPKIKRFVNKIPKIITNIILALFIIDIIFSFIL